MAEEQLTIDVPVLRRAAMDFLARREHSQRELHDKLSRRFPDAEPQLRERVIAELAAEGLQSDARFTEAWIRYRKSKGFGYRHIRADLESRGLASTVIEQYLFTDDEDWLDTARALVDRKLRTDSLEFGGKEHRRLLRFLESRGFAHGEISQSLEPYLKQGRF
jgi:regulatory protein